MRTKSESSWWQVQISTQKSLGMAAISKFDLQITFVSTRFIFQVSNKITMGGFFYWLGVNLDLMQKLCCKLF
jgi:hypothetical protein